MKYLSYAAQWIDKEDIKVVNKVLLSDYLTQGPMVARFEKAVAGYCGAKYAIAVNSGTSALHIACISAGLAKGDEAITSPVTFVASANSILYCGARPIFADIEDDTACVDAREIRKKITSKTKAIIPVHFGGHPCEMEAIYKTAKKKDILVIEDASHAFGAEFKGERIGSCKYSAMTVFSFHAIKHITTGEGGMVLTNKKELYQRMLLLRTHGITKDPKFLKQYPGPWYYEMQQLGFNYRLTDIQCALGLNQLKKISKFVARRREIVNGYNKSFSHLEGVRFLKERPNVKSSHHLYVIRLAFRKIKIPKKEVFNEYKKLGILVNVHYLPVYLHPFYKKIGYRPGLCPAAENYYEEAITLPLYPRMTEREVKRVITATEKISNKYKYRVL
jgi:perosamine synthetase